MRQDQNLTAHTAVERTIRVRDAIQRKSGGDVADERPRGVNIASLYQYFPGKEAIVAELRRRHGADQRAALRLVLAEHTAGELESTIRTLVSVGVAGHAQSPRLHRVFTEEIPALGYPDIAAIAAPIFDAMRRFLQQADVDARDMDLALWMISTASGAVLHRAAVERPEDLSSGVIAEELITLLCRYLRRRAGPRRRTREGPPVRRHSPRA